MKEFFKRNSKSGASGDNAGEIRPASAKEDPNNLAKSDLKPEINQTEEKTPTFSNSNPTKPSHHNIPDNLWVKCPKCRELLYSKELENNKKVCQKCGHHFRLGARERIAFMVDEGSFEEIDGNLISSDPLEFVSLTEPPYRIKAAQLREKTGLNEAVLSGIAAIENLPLAICVSDFAFQGGSMGSVFGEKLVRVAERAIEQRLPLVTVSASGGARMHEGVFSLMQMAKTTAVLARLGEERLLHISILTDPVTGGVTASYASIADFILAEPGALIGFAGPRVIEQTTRQKLPPGFQTAEFFMEHGMVDRVVPRKELRTTLANLLRLYAPSPRALTINLNGNHSNGHNGTAQLQGETVYAR